MHWSKSGTGKPIVVTAACRDALLADIADRMDNAAGYAVATLNLDHVVKLRRDPEFHAAYSAHSHVTADGNPIVWLSHLAGQPDVELVPGSELVLPVTALAAERDIPVALFGSTGESLDAAAEVLKARMPELRIVLRHSPPMSFDPTGPEAGTAVSEIEASGARLVLLALGAPKQEIFAAFARKRLPDVGFLSIGAGLDFISGKQKRAPIWVQRIAAEWLWRLAGDPGRLARRYGDCLVAFPGLTARAVHARCQRKAPR